MLKSQMQSSTGQCSLIAQQCFQQSCFQRVSYSPSLEQEREEEGPGNDCTRRNGLDTPFLVMVANLPLTLLIKPPPPKQYCYLHDQVLQTLESLSAQHF